MSSPESHNHGNALEIFFRMSAGLVCIAGFDGYLKRINPAWKRVLGYSTSELLEKPFLEYVHPADRESTLKEMGKLSEGMPTVSFENRYVCKDSSFKWLLWQAVPLVEQGEIYAIAQDITEVKASQEALREVNQRFESEVRERTAELTKVNAAWQAVNQTLDSMVSAAPLAIVAMDESLTVRSWNPAAERIFGWHARETIGRPVPFVPDGRREEMNDLRTRAVGGEVLVNIEVKRLRRDGETVELLLSSAPLRDKDGRSLGFIAMYTDITERNHLERRFLRAQRLESLGTLAGGIAHDLNNILAPILMAVQLLSMKSTDADDRDILQTLETSARRGGDLVKQVLTFSRGVQGERVLLQPRHVISEVNGMLRQTLPKSIHIVIDTPSELRTIYADATQIHQILMNLCVNARDAMPQGGTLTIAARNTTLDENRAAMNPGAQPGPYVLIEVRDSGTGIPREIIDKIFDPFFTTKELGKGTGLGLSTAVAIAKAHGGFISVYSEPNHGTKFTVYLPATTPVEAENAGGPHGVPFGEGELVLVVDDEAAVRDIARATLEAYHYRVITAADGEEGVAVFLQHVDEIAVVVTDYSMPVMDGFAMIRSLEKVSPDVRVISMSGLRPSERPGDQHSSPSIKAFLSKPFTAEQLIRALHDVLS